MNYYYQPQPTLCGRIVGSIEEARAESVTPGSFSVFPTGDLNKVFIKAWNTDGTTRVDEFQKVIKVEPTITLDDVVTRLNELSEKIDNMSKSTTTYPINKGKKEVATS